LIVETFLDSNVLIYAASGRLDAPEKYAVARGLLTTEFGTSAQVLGEFYSNVIRKGDVPLDPVSAKRWVELLARKPFQVNDASVALRAVDLSQRYRIRYWDAAILAAAEKLGAKTVYSEDLSHGQTYGAVTVINPFLED
jgi:predicted nucleic acid-binding protein